MSEDKFTPKPWYVDANGMNYTVWVKGKFRDIMIAQVDYLYDANLISAAPDMFEVIESVEWINHEKDGFPYCPCCGHFKVNGHHKDCKLDAVLRKAVVK